MLGRIQGFPSKLTSGMRLPHFSPILAVAIFDLWKNVYFPTTVLLLLNLGQLSGLGCH